MSAMTLIWGGIMSVLVIFALPHDVMNALGPLTPLFIGFGLGGLTCLFALIMGED